MYNLKVLRLEKGLNMKDNVILEKILRYKNYIGRIWRQIEETKRIIKEKTDIVDKYDKGKKDIDDQNYDIAGIVKDIKTTLNVSTRGEFDLKYHFDEESTFLKELVAHVEQVKCDTINQKST